MTRSLAETAPTVVILVLSVVSIAAASVTLAILSERQDLGWSAPVAEGGTLGTLDHAALEWTSLSFKNQATALRCLHSERPDKGVLFADKIGTYAVLSAGLRSHDAAHVAIIRGRLEDHPSAHEPDLVQWSVSEAS
jgi:hypothetical protein